jgi:DNA-binding LytR/AlgR family response regulator
LERSEDRGEPAQVVRVHRALLVNTGRIREIASLGGGDYERLVGTQLLKSSRRYQRAATDLLQK